MTREDCFSLAPRSLAAMPDWLLAEQASGWQLRRREKAQSFICLPGRVPKAAGFAMADYRKKNAFADDLDGSLASAPETGADSTSIRQAHADVLIQRLKVNSDMTAEDCFSLALRSLAAMIDWLLASQMRKPEFR